MSLALNQWERNRYNILMTGPTGAGKSKALGLTRARIYEWIAKYREGGIEALRRRKASGRSP